MRPCIVQRVAPAKVVMWSPSQDVGQQRVCASHSSRYVPEAGSASAGPTLSPGLLEVDSSRVHCTGLPSPPVPVAPIPQAVPVTHPSQGIPPVTFVPLSVPHAQSHITCAQRPFAAARELLAQARRSSSNRFRGRAVRARRRCRPVTEILGAHLEHIVCSSYNQQLQGELNNMDENCSQHARDIDELNRERRQGACSLTLEAHRLRNRLGLETADLLCDNDGEQGRVATGVVRDAVLHNMHPMSEKQLQNWSTAIDLKMQVLQERTQLEETQRQVFEGQKEAILASANLKVAQEVFEQQAHELRSKLSPGTATSNSRAMGSSQEVSFTELWQHCEALREPAQLLRSVSAEAGLKHPSITACTEEAQDLLEWLGVLAVRLGSSRRLRTHNSPSPTPSPMNTLARNSIQRGRVSPLQGRAPRSTRASPLRAHGIK